MSSDHANCMTMAILSKLQMIVSCNHLKFWQNGHFQKWFSIIIYDNGHFVKITNDCIMQSFEILTKWPLSKMIFNNHLWQWPFCQNSCCNLRQGQKLFNYYHVISKPRAFLPLPHYYRYEWCLKFFGFKW